MPALGSITSDHAAAGAVGATGPFAGFAGFVAFVTRGRGVVSRTGTEVVEGVRSPGRVEFALAPDVGRPHPEAVITRSAINTADAKVADHDGAVRGKSTVDNLPSCGCNCLVTLSYDDPGRPMSTQRPPLIPRSEPIPRLPSPTVSAAESSAAFASGFSSGGAILVRVLLSIWLKGMSLPGICNTPSSS
jgi:hypothetical protein